MTTDPEVRRILAAVRAVALRAAYRNSGSARSMLTRRAIGLTLIALGFRIAGTKASLSALRVV